MTRQILPAALLTLMLTVLLGLGYPLFIPNWPNACFRRRPMVR